MSRRQLTDYSKGSVILQTSFLRKPLALEALQTVRSLYSPLLGAASERSQGPGPSKTRREAEKHELMEAWRWIMEVLNELDSK